MKIAIPVSNGVLCMHFGHCEEFSIIDAEPESKTITEIRTVEPPPHEPGLLPRWLHEMGVELVIAGGMGGRAQQIFLQNGIKVLVGAKAKQAEELVNDYLCGILETGANTCDH